MRKQVTAINALEESIAALDDAALAAKTAEFRSRLEAGEKHDALLPEASPWCARRASGYSACAISTSRVGAWRCTMGVSPR